MNLKIMSEQVEDYTETEGVIKSAFAHAEHSDKREHELVSRIRKTDAFIPELSLMAKDKDHNKIIGHILLSKIIIHNDEKRVESLALAPLSVLPSFNAKGLEVY